VKKLIFLLLMAVAVVGFMPAGAAYPPGEITLETALAEYGVQQGVVTQPTVLVSAMPVMAELPSLQLATALLNDSARLQNSGTLPIINTGQFGAISAAEPEAGYYLRC